VCALSGAESEAVVVELEVEVCMEVEEVNVSAGDCSTYGWSVTNIEFAALGSVVEMLSFTARVGVGV